MFRLYRTDRNHITIDVSARKLTLFQGDTVLGTYPIAIGKSSTPTPLGRWQVVNKKILRDPSVFGSRWIGLSAPSYGIHGTNNPASIGTAASLGCIRMHNRDVEEVFPQVSIGTPVLITNGTSAAAKGHGKTYTVRPGDTLWQIAHTHQISLDALMAANPTVSPHNLFAGQTVLLP